MMNRFAPVNAEVYGAGQSIVQVAPLPESDVGAPPEPPAAPTMIPPVFVPSSGLYPHVSPTSSTAVVPIA